MYATVLEPHDNYSLVEKAILPHKYSNGTYYFPLYNNVIIIFFKHTNTAGYKCINPNIL